MYEGRIWSSSFHVHVQKNKILLFKDSRLFVSPVLYYPLKKKDQCTTEVQVWHGFKAKSFVIWMNQSI